MRRSPSYEIILETCIDALDQANEMGLARGINQMFRENIKPLKSACHRLHLSIKPIKYQASRYDFDERFHLYVYVLYHQDLPENFKARGYYLKTPMEDCISSIQMSLKKCRYSIKHNRKTDKYWLYDNYNHCELNSMEDYNNSLLINDRLLKYEDIFKDELTRIHNGNKNTDITVCNQAM